MYMYLHACMQGAVLGYFGHGHFGQDISATDISATDISANGHFGHGHFGHGKKYILFASADGIQQFTTLQD